MQQVMDYNNSIVVHDGKFHCDEVVSYTILKYIYPDKVLVRTRDKTIIDQGDIIVDVGKEYDPDNNKYDHHQESCSETFNKNYIIPLSSAGMIWKHYGKEYLKKLLNIETASNGLHIKIYDKLIREIDAIDNGIYNSFDKYPINTNISLVVSLYNSNDTSNDEEQYSNFLKASEYCRMLLEIIVKETYNKQILFNEEYGYIKNVIDGDVNNNINRNYLIVKRDIINYRECVVKYCKENNKTIDWIIFPKNNFTEWGVCKIWHSSKDLISEDEAREKLGNSSDLIFIHKKLFTGSTKTLESTIEIAELSR